MTFRVPADWNIVGGLPRWCGSQGHCRGGVEERVDGHVDLGCDHLRGGDVERPVEVLMHTPSMRGRRLLSRA